LIAGNGLAGVLDYKRKPGATAVPILKGRTWLTGLTVATAVACGGQESDLSSSDHQAVAAALESYRRAWLANDKGLVLETVSDSIVLFLPGAGAGTVSGKTAVASFWFPPSDTLYLIREYEITDQQIYGSGSFAIAQGRSVLSWDTVVRDSTVGAATSKSEFLTILRREGGRWRLYRQMFLTRG
jgi:ketosteroid isomerase-like protein